MKKENTVFCEICEDVGYLRKFVDGQEYIKVCTCQNYNENKERFSRMGILQTIERCSFDTFECKEQWQTCVKELAETFAQETNIPNGNCHWFFIGGQSGSGKSHICAAIIGKLMKHHPIRFMDWIQENGELKRFRNHQSYGDMIQRLQRAGVLYIDDFLKTARTESDKISAADITTAYEILNERYKHNRITLISSEFSIDELYEIDGAVAGRIAERAGKYLISLQGKEKDQRKRGIVL